VGDDVLLYAVARHAMKDQALTHLQVLKQYIFTFYYYFLVFLYTLILLLLTGNALLYLYMEGTLKHPKGCTKVLHKFCDTVLREWPYLTFKLHRADSIEALKMFRGYCKPTWLFILGGDFIPLVVLLRSHCKKAFRYSRP